MIPNFTCWFEILSPWFVAQRGMRKQHCCILLNSNGKKNTPLKFFTALLNDPKNERWGRHNCQVEWLPDTSQWKTTFSVGWRVCQASTVWPKPGVCLGDDLFENLQPNILGLSEREPIKDCLDMLPDDGNLFFEKPMFGAGIRMGMAW